jgi:sigma-B regulation protein RsbU (phosphoserine phosphatase)
MAGTLRGSAEVEAAARRWFAAFPDFTVHPEHLLIDGNQVAEEVTIEGTDTGGFLSMPSTGKHFRLPTVFLYTLIDDAIVWERRLYDFARLLLQLAGNVGTVIDSGRFYRETLDRARLEQEIRIAADIQRQLLPSGRYAGATFEAAAASAPCREIGGDFFDYYDLQPDGFSFVLGDVAGKGPPAALLTAMLQGILATHTSLVSTPAQLVKHVNDILVRRTIPSRFATFIYAALSPHGTLTYCNAGHNPPLLITARGVRSLDTGGLIAGAFSQATFAEETLQLQPGDLLVAFSDGITEAVNAAGEEFGEERLLACVMANRQLNPSSVLDCLLGAVQQFSENTVRTDDQTALVLRYVG